MKKILLILCMITGIFSMTILAGATSDTKYYNGYTADDLKSNSESLYTSLSEFTDEELAQYLMSGDTITSQAVKSWSNIKDEIGEFVGIGDFEVEESKDAITTKLLVDYSERDVILTVVYDENLSVISITAEKEYTLGETMKKAGLNTIMGMGTVFAILILIAFLISLFKYINKWEESKKIKNNDVTNQDFVKKPVIESVVAEEELVDDLELIAVISAAIAASMGTSTDEFIVRSIKRRATKRQ